mmetsp:Transcript_91561/g.274917  ORF Transcript_91561/g.274917 Transcript_91561/m.274917 type:complete len:759 (-) Transcript_91561:284-2560(-)
MPQGETTGGFSSLDANLAPAYQAKAVAAYLKTSGSRPQSNINVSRRCVPDLAAYSTAFYTVQDGSDQVIGGTSAATPVVAGMLSLLNDALLAAGHRPLGFANPFLYSNADAFLDITHGDNGGYAAVPGYDPASGLGTFSPQTFATLTARVLAGRARKAAATLVETPTTTTPAGDSSSPTDACTLLAGLRLPSASLASLERTFWAVADPSSAAFRQHRSRTELQRLVLPEARAWRKAVGWLRSIGADVSAVAAEPTSDSIRAHLPCSTTTPAPAVPQGLRDIVDFAVLLRPRTPPTSMATSEPNTSPRAGLSSGFGPSQQKAAYGVPSDLKGTNKDNSQMVWGPGTFGFRKDDLEMFFSTYAPTSSVDDVSLDVHNKWTGATGENFPEGTLDASYAAAFAPGVKTIVANTNTTAATENGEAFGPALLAFLIDLNGRDKVPYVLSMSLGSLSYAACSMACTALAAKKSHSYDDCWEYLQSQHQACMFGSAEIEQRIDVELMKLGLRGVTVTAASGDGGSHFAFGPFSGSIGGALDGIICSSLQMPVYPASSPYVLSVGGTAWTAEDPYGPSCGSTKPCGWASSGGGFSWASSAPFQGNTAAAYLSRAKTVAPHVAPDPSTYNATGRGYPDLAALAQFGIPLCDYGGCSGSGGTSASAPTVAGMLTLINDARLNAGKKPLGFVNSKLYQLMADPTTVSECFLDVGVESLGELWDCQTYSTCTGCDDASGGGNGFVATKGWDAQTGFGQPLFPGLLKHLAED